MLDNKKTININPLLFSSEKTKTKTLKREKKQKPIIPKSSNEKTQTLRKKLLNKIKQHQKKQNYLDKKENNSNANSKENKNQNNSNTNNNQLFDDEFTKSLAYLSALSKTKHLNKKNKKQNQTHPQIQQNQTQIQQNQNQNQTQPQKKELRFDNIIENIDINHSGGNIVSLLSNKNNNHHNYTLKNTNNDNKIDENKIQSTEVALNLPNSLIKPKIEIDLTVPSSTQSNNLNIDSHQNQNDDYLINTISNIKIGNDPPYGVLRNGSKPTYRQYNQTKKNVNTNNLNTNSIKIHDYNPPNVISVREQKLEELKQIAKEEQLIKQNKNKFNNILLNKNHQNNNKNSKSRIKTIRKTTTTTKFKLGKNAKKRVISVLIKNNQTRRKIKKEISDLKRTAIKDIKQYLKKHGLLKTGSNAPSDILRQLYEQSILSGDIHNKSKDILLHNYLNDTDDNW